MELYYVKLINDTLYVKFGEPSSNDKIVPFVEEKLKSIKLPGGKILKINGPASLPVAFILAHATVHKYGSVALFDPKLCGYVVCATHSPEYPLGTILPAGEDPENIWDIES